MCSLALGLSLCCALPQCMAALLEAQMPALLAKRGTFPSETPLSESQLCLRVENLPLPMSFKVPITEDKPLFIPIFV